MNNIEQKYIIAKRTLVFWCLFIGIGAILGGACFLIKPDGSILGMDAMLPYFQILPFSDVLFQNFIFSGISLIIVNGITNILASVLILKNNRIGIILGTIFGFTLMLWICIQFYIFPLNFMSTIYFIFGFFQLITGYICYVHYNQKNFAFDINNYKNIGVNKNNKELVVYFSREGYTKKIAYELANNNGAEILEIKTTEKIEGKLGFLWCGRFGMHRWGMPIEKIDIDIEKFDKITICSPIWVFDISAPIRKFLEENAQKIHRIDYVFVHFIKKSFTKIANRIDKVYNVKHEKITNVCCRFGKLKKITNQTK